MLLQSSLLLDNSSETNRNRAASCSPQSGSSLGFRHHQDLISILDAVGVQCSSVVLHFLWTKGAVLVDVVKSHAFGGQLDHFGQLLPQLCYRLVQADTKLREKTNHLCK